MLAGHPFFRDLAEPHLDTEVGRAANAVFEPGEFVFREGEAADQATRMRLLDLHGCDGDPTRPLGASGFAGDEGVA